MKFTEERKIEIELLNTCAIFAVPIPEGDTMTAAQIDIFIEFEQNCLAGFHRFDSERRPWRIFVMPSEKVYKGFWEKVGEVFGEPEYMEKVC